MKRRPFSLLLALLLTALVAGCGPKEELIAGEPAQPTPASQTDNTAESPGETASGPVELVFLRAGTDDSARSFWTAVIDEYTAANPNVTIEFQEAPWGDDIETKLNTAFASGTAPDVLAFNIASLGQRVPLGQYEPLDRYFAGWEGKDDLLDSMKSIGMVGDTLYGITYGPNPHVFCWRADLFEQAGLDPDAPPKNWDELLDYHQKLTVAEGGQTVQAGLSFPTTGTNSYQFYQSLIMQNGVKNFIDEETDELLFHSPEGVEALQFIGKLSQTGYLPYNYDSADNDPFIKGQSAMAFESISNYNKAATAEGWGEHVRVTGPLTQRATATFCGANLFYITSQSKDKDAAWEFIEFNMTPDILWKSFEEMGTPVVRRSMEEQFVQMNPELNSAIFDAVQAGTGVAKVPYVWSVLNALNTAIEKTILGEAAPEDALEEAYEIAQAEIDSM